MFRGRPVQPGEPAWTDEDRWLALALTRAEDDVCSGCGHPRRLAWHRDADGEYLTETYECHACHAVHAAASAWSGDKDRLPPYMHVASLLDPTVKTRSPDFPLPP